MEASLRSSASASFTLGDLNQHRVTPSYDHPPSSTVLDFGGFLGEPNQRYD
jgi:hypothetical protein